MRGGLVAVPVDSQYVILLDAATGAELAQVLSTAEAATFVRALPEGMFFGSRGVFLLSAGDRARLAPVARLPAAHAAGVRAAVLLVRPLSSRAGALLGDRSQPHPVARDRERRARAVPRRHWSSCTTIASSSGSTRRRARCAGPTAIRRPTPSRRRTRAARSCSSPPTASIGALDARDRRAPSIEARLPGGVVRGATFDAEGFCAAARRRGRGGPRRRWSRRWRRSSPIRIGGSPRPEAVRDRGARAAAGTRGDRQLLESWQAPGLPPLAAARRPSEALAARKDAASARPARGGAAQSTPTTPRGARAPPVDSLARAAGALGPSARTAAPGLVAQLRRPETTPARWRRSRARWRRRAPRRRCPRCATS